MDDAGIARVWRGWTTPDNADAYERIARTEVFPAIMERNIPGLIEAHVMRADDVADGEVEFTTIIWFDSIESVKGFMGENYREAHLPKSARAVLERFDSQATHLHVTGRFA